MTPVRQVALVLSLLALVAAAVYFGRRAVLDARKTEGDADHSQSRRRLLFSLLGLGGASVALATETLAAPASSGDDALAPFFRHGPLAVTTGSSRFRFPFAVRLLGVSASVAGAPTGSALVLDVNRNGTSVFRRDDDRPAVAPGAFATSAEARPAVTGLDPGDYLTVDVDEVGSAAPGEDLTVFVRYRKA